MQITSPKTTCKKNRRPMEGGPRLNGAPFTPKFEMLVRDEGDPNCVHHLVQTSSDWAIAHDVFHCQKCPRVVSYPKWLPSKDWK